MSCAEFSYPASEDDVQRASPASPHSVMPEVNTGACGCNTVLSSPRNDAEMALETEWLPSNTVFLNVYDISDANGFLYFAGIGAHHTGVEVYGTEFAYGSCQTGSGVYETGPRYTEPHPFREQLVLGLTQLTREEVYAVIEELKMFERWSGQAYHMVKNNCNNFSEAFARAILPPEVRVKQLEFIEVYDNGEREQVGLEDGTVASVPVVMPKWVNRLARGFSRLMPSDSGY